MGNYMSCHSIEVGFRRGRVVLPGGAVHEFDQPVTVAELMLEHHQHYVVEYRPAANGKLHPLPADHRLDTGKVYVMVPKSTAVSAEEARRMVLFSSRSETAKGRSLLLFATCLAGVDKKGRESVVSWPTEMEEKVGVVEWSVEGLEERPQFLSREFSSKGWKPSLGTIEERTLERKVSHWLF